MENHQTLAIVFPGQGSQSVGMLADLALQYPNVKAVFNQASDILGYDLWQLTQAGPAAQLDQTQYTQPALLAAGYAVWQILQMHYPALKPALLAGHSLGEYTALVCAHAITFADGIKLVAARGSYMQEAVPEGIGAMGAIIGLDEATVASLCHETAQANEVLAPANFNSPGQVVVAGHKAAVERVLAAAKSAKAKLTVLLPVSVPSHCALMKPAAEKLATMLNATPIAVPHIPVVSNVDAAIYTSPDAIREGLTRQLYLPVRWVEIITGFAAGQYNAQTMTTIFECGPGKVLTGLNKRIAKDIKAISTNDMMELSDV